MRRAYDQIRQGVAISALNVKVVGSSAGFSDFGDGTTHQSVDDVDNPAQRQIMCKGGAMIVYSDDRIRHE